MVLEIKNMQEIDYMHHEFLTALDIMENKLPRPVLGKPYELPKMGPGIYNLDESFSFEKKKCTKHQVASDEIFVFRDEASRAFQDEVKRFWESEDKFKQMGFLHKRGIILSGPPGSGKTSMLKQEMKRLVEQGQMIFLSKSPWRLQSALHEFRKLEAKRPVTVIIEDIDEVCNGYGEYQFLELLDGSEAINNVLFIATTNNMEKLSEKLRRPGRFDRKIEIPNPNAELRRVYLEKKFGNRINKNKINDIVSLTEGLSFGHLREIVVSHCGYGVQLNETVDRLRKDILTETKSPATPLF